MRHLATLCLLALVSLGASKPAPKAFPNYYRLTKNILPSDYVINLSLTQLSFMTKTFSGTVDITLKAQNATKEIKLHASSLSIVDVTLSLSPGNILVGKPISLSEASDIEAVTFTFEEELDPAKTYNLNIVYIGKLDDKDMYGFYQSKYTDDDGNDKYLATTQFESTYARRAFPCFDEPEFKATFTVTITSPVDYPLVASNTALDGAPLTGGGLTTRKFKKTPTMSSYLVAFIVSQFESAKSEADPKFSVIHKPGAKVDLVLQQGPQFLQKLSEFTGIDYYDKMIPKMDVAAIPDFAAGAMENWGLVTFREIVLLDDGEDTSEYIKQRIAITVAHEFVHQWFGDWVTLDWWSNAWLNEGFAEYFENYIVNEVSPEFQMINQSIVTEKQPIMVTDGFKSVEPLSSPAANVNTPAECDNKFSLITYDKGQHVIRMLNNFLDGLDKDNKYSIFQSGLMHYLSNDALKLHNVKPSDLLESFEAVQDLSTILPKDKKLGDVMQEWIFSAGYPVVTATLTDDKVTLSQERFLYDLSGNDTTKWYVPISFISKSKKDESRTWLSPDGDAEITLSDKGDWIIINDESKGFYRVNYDDTLWSRIISELKDEKNTISDLTKAQIVDDIFNLARANKASYETAFDLAAFLTNETSYYPWTAAFNSFSYLIKRTGSSALGTAISKRLLALLDSLYTENKPDPIKEDHVDILNQAQALTWACNLGHEDCVKFAQDTFQNYKKDSTKAPVNTNFRSFVYCTALRNSADAEDWNFLWEQYATASSAHQNIILAALGCTTNETILNEYLYKSITDGSGIRKQDGFTAFKSVYNGNPSGVDVAYAFLKEHYNAVAQYYKGMSSLADLLTQIADLFTTQKQLDDLSDFLKTDDLSDEFQIVGQQAVEKASVNVNWLNNFEKQLNTIFKTSSAGSAQIGMTVFIMSLMALFVFNF